MSNSIYDYESLQFNGKLLPLDTFKGKVILIVNTASQCYFTKQFKSLEKLYQTYKDQGFEILAYPSNDFGNQEPKTGLNLETFCRVNQQVTFPVFKRIHVVGDYKDPLYTYLTDKTVNGTVDSKPKWNFHKYLINKEGKVVDFYYSFTSPLSSKVKNKIEELLSE
ncbi:glutathione peroxidase [Sphingobacterium hungaricum]